MAAIKTYYPQFVPNQILTNAQLNQLRTHLDEQERSTRTRLIGIGKVCGLTWKIHPAPRAIEIAEGYGVTSDGYLVALGHTTLTHYRVYSDPREGEGSPRYELWEDLENKQVLELLDEATALTLLSSDGTEETEDTLVDDPKPLADLTLADHVLVLYLEKEPVNLNSCLVTNCDNKGLNINLNVRVLLLPKERLEQLEGCGPSPAVVSVPRLHAMRPLDTIHTTAELNQAYGGIVIEQMKPMILNMGKAFELVGRFLGMEKASIDRMGKLQQSLRYLQTNGTLNQYHYDLIKDLARAHDELVVKACDLVRDCCPESEFPCHILLGALDGGEGYCHEFVPASVRNVMQGDLDLVKKLFQRVLIMAGNVVLTLGKRVVRITPSQTEHHALGTRAIPFYYKFITELQDCWQPKLCCTTDRLWAYHNDDIESSGEEDLALRDIDFDYNRSSFLRIEGHVGLACDKALETIEQLRTQHNVEFDLLCLYFQDRKEEELALKKKVRDVQASLDGFRSELKVLFMGFLIAPEGMSEELRKKFKGLFETIKTVGQELLIHDRNWRSVRRAKRLVCDVGNLQADYLSIRSQLMCQLHNIRSLVPESKLGLSDNEGQIPADIDANTRLILQLGLSASFVHEQSKQLLEQYLPNSLCEFNLELFFDQYKALNNDLIWYHLVLTDLHRARERNSGEALKTIEALLAQWGQEEYRSGVRAGLRGCLDFALAPIFAAYEKVREQDLGLFKNFVKNFPGMEHLAGVEKGGTFILVCDRVGEENTEKIVADFSLAGHVPCCCHINPADLCLPVLAQPDYRVVYLKPQGEGFEPAKLRLHVLMNDVDLNLSEHDQSEEDGQSLLELSLENTKTELGGVLTIDPKIPAVIQYVHPKPPVGVVDRFSYTLIRKDKNCPGMDIGHVLILLMPMPEEEPKLETATITGRVFIDPPSVFAPGSLVTILGINFSQTQKAGQKGEFEFKDLPLGAYTLQASKDGSISETKSVTLEKGATVFVELTLLPVATGAIRGTVRDAVVGIPIDKATVTIRGRIEKTVTDSKGQFAFEGLRPDNYTLIGVAAFYKVGEKLGKVGAGGITQSEITLQPLTIRENIRDPFVGFVAETTRLEPAAAKKKAQDVYGTRYDTRVKELKAAGAGPTIIDSVQLTRARDFIVKTIVDPKASDAKVAELYLEVSNSQVTAITAGNATQKKTLRALLSTVSLAYLDRLTLTNPQSLSTEAKNGVNAVKAILIKGGVKTSPFRTSWKSTVLLGELNVKSARTIDSLLAPRIL